MGPTERETIIDAIKTITFSNIEDRLFKAAIRLVLDIPFQEAVNGNKIRAWSEYAFDENPIMEEAAEALVKMGILSRVALPSQTFTSVGYLLERRQRPDESNFTNPRHEGLIRNQKKWGGTGAIIGKLDRNGRPVDDQPF